jgi:nicotinamidase-related amidase
MVTALDKNTALVLIDLQKSIVQRQLVHPVPGIIANSIKLVDAFRKHSLPIVFVNVDLKDAKWINARTETNSARSMTMAADWNHLIPELKTASNDIFITKHSWGAFFETSLDDELKKRNVTGIVLGGIATSIGVEGTARQASERGYNVSFAKDAMTDMVASAHEHSLQIIFPRIGEIDDTDNIIKKLAERV